MAELKTKPTKASVAAFLEEVDERGYYDIRNRTALEVDGEGNKTSVKVDMRDISGDVTVLGAHRGGTHRHEYSRDGKRIGFTYDDFLVRDYDRTIGFMQPDENAPEGYTHYFSVILKPAKMGKSKAGEIEKAYGDSWVDAAGTMRAFIGKVRAKNGTDYENDLFVAHIPADIDITTSFAGRQDQYPEPPEGITLRRLTHGWDVSGILRGSSDRSQIAFVARDGDGINQLFVTNAVGSDKETIQVTNLRSPVSSIRWHPSGEWVFFISDGNLFVTYVGTRLRYGKTLKLSDDRLIRDQLVVSPDGTLLAYVMPVPTKDGSGTIVKDANGNDFRQIFTMELDWKRLDDASK